MDNVIKELAQTVTAEKVAEVAANAEKRSSVLADATRIMIAFNSKAKK